jgi:hypothetical protein
MISIRAIYGCCIRWPPSSSWYRYLRGSRGGLLSKPLLSRLGIVNLEHVNPDMPRYEQGLLGVMRDLFEEREKRYPTNGTGRIYASVCVVRFSNCKVKNQKNRTSMNTKGSWISILRRRKEGSRPSSRLSHSASYLPLETLHYAIPHR